ncbi:DUF7192 family protein [Epilithonimonas arachidiradicis]|uniref:Phage protein n=1 Tax=Epilithonimonas arachidiradicis TaxID=1617282 RepID=A0A420CMA9_9FLAO|nr:hypothetical protein [Epilithonimonas arachidiradicis]RKE79554.1 hypothetical protein BXY58_3206 [Epilithonimonas arachidiradicis]GGG66129.1 phage protein [Epilithonimonas arachidiradicis]
MFGNRYLQFGNLQDFWDFSFRESISYKKDSRKPASEWYGGVTWEQTKKLATSGWWEGMEKVRSITAELSEVVATKIVRYDPEYCFAGNVVDVGMFLSNSPEYFLTKQIAEQEIKGKIVTIVCNISVSAAINSDVIIQKGAMVCALVDALEMSGYRCEIILNETSQYYESKLEVDVCIKKSNQSLNFAELAFCLAHPAMLRRIMFSVAELEGWADFAHAYGRPCSASQKGDIYVDEIFSLKVRNAEAIDWIIKQLQNQGVHLKNTY